LERFQGNFEIVSLATLQQNYDAQNTANLVSSIAPIHWNWWTCG
jgi:hypothetical protein